METLLRATEFSSGTALALNASEIWGRHRGLILRATQKYRRARPDLREEILQEAQIALSRALETYRADSGIALSTYLSHQVDWAVYRFLSKFTRRDASTYSLDEPFGADDGGTFTLADVADAQAAKHQQSASIADEHLLKRMSELREAVATCTMTQRERIVLRKFLESGNAQKIADELGISEQRVSQVMTSVVRKLRLHLKLWGLPSSHEFAITDGGSVRKFIPSEGV